MEVLGEKIMLMMRFRYDHSGGGIEAIALDSEAMYWSKKFVAIEINKKYERNSHGE